MIVDIAKIRIGDCITVRREVDRVAMGDPEFPVRIVGTPREWVRASDIVGHEPRGFEVGDKIRHGPVHYEVRAVHGEFLWAERPDASPGASMWTLRSSNCDRVEDAP